LGIGDWGLGPIPNPQSPIPNPHASMKIFDKYQILYKIYFNINHILYLNKNLISIFSYLKIKIKIN